MNYIRFSVSIFILMILLIGCSNVSEKKEKVTLTISAAASLSDALSEIQSLFQSKNSNIELTINFGGSGALQQQIKQGAPVDVFISAAEKPFDELIDEGLIDSNNYSNIIGNSLVLIAPLDSKLSSVNSLTEVKKIAIGTPEAVPAGNYAKQALASLHVWDSIHSNIVMAKDVRQVLTYVETGNVDAGFVYNTDALSSDKIKVIEEIGQELHDSIVYPAGVVKSTKKKEEALSFYQFLYSEQSIEVFKKYGFRVLE